MKIWGYWVRDWTKNQFVDGGFVIHLELNQKSFSAYFYDDFIRLEVCDREEIGTIWKKDFG